MRVSLLFPLALAAALGATACHKLSPPANSLDAMDNELVNGAVTDEAEARRELANAITVDPKRAHHGHAAADRPATTSLGSIAERQRNHPAMPAVTESSGNCANSLVYSNNWAKMLPADLPMHPQATLEEAAGHDGDCRIRIVSFTVPGDRSAVLGWYEQKAKAAGYGFKQSAKGSDEIIEGDKGDMGYLIMAGPMAHGATPVDYIWTKGS